MIVIDTEALLWVDQDDPRLGQQARARIVEALDDGVLGVSTITFWEVEELLRRGMLATGLRLTEWRRDLLDAGLRELFVDGINGYDDEDVSSGDFLATAKAGISIARELGSARDRAAIDKAPHLITSLIVGTAMRANAELLTTDQEILRWAATSGKLICHDARQ
jgi:hypothetical protein